MKIDFPNIIKGAIYAIIVAAPVLMAVIFRITNVQGYLIWFLYAVLESIAVTFVYLQLKRAFMNAGKKPETPAKDAKSSKEAKGGKAEKTDASAKIAPGDVKEQKPAEEKKEEN